MSIVTRRSTLVLASLLAAGAAGAAAPANAQAATGCSTAWGSVVKSAGPSAATTGARLRMPRVGHHACYDRVVYDVRGPVGNVVVGYVAGAPTPTLGVVVTKVAPVSGMQDVALSSPGLSTVRTVDSGIVTGTTFTTGVRTRARLPFRVFTLKGPGATNRVVVDVAHTW